MDCVALIVEDHQVGCAVRLACDEEKRVIVDRNVGNIRVADNDAVSICLQLQRLCFPGFDRDVASMCSIADQRGSAAGKGDLYERRHVGTPNNCL